MITPVTDAVNELAEMAFKKNVKVVFVEKGMLEKYQGICLITEF